jgi:hypothetical protein
MQRVAPKSGESELRRLGSFLRSACVKVVDVGSLVREIVIRHAHLSMRAAWTTDVNCLAPEGGADEARYRGC